MKKNRKATQPERMEISGGLSGQRDRTGKVTQMERIEVPSFTDPQGSWTGVPLDPSEEPVQDADDL